jgi:hypothetical protein
MKLLIKCTLLTALVLNPVHACNWKTDIQRDGARYSYSASCHEKVGSLVIKARELEKANSERKKQAEKLTSSLKMSELALDKADKRIRNWRDEAYNQHERLLKQKKLAKFNDWVYFGSGIGLTILSVWAAGQIK